MFSYEEALRRAEAYHGHICSGQVLGVRMIRHGLELMGLENDSLRDLVVIVESDRCVLDAIYAATGLTMGRRRVKLQRRGKLAMSLIDLKTGLGLRLRMLVEDFPPHDADCRVWWNRYADAQLFAAAPVKVTLKPEELPGMTTSIVVCARCGETVLDNLHVVRDGQILCRDCAGEKYWEEVR